MTAPAVPEPSPFAGRAAIVTGGGSGIGRATAILLARSGASVAVVDRDAAAAEAAASAAAESGGRSIAVTADVSREADCARAVSTAAAEFGDPRVLINNAGMMRRGSVVEITEDDWDRVMETNVRSMYLMCRAVIPLMARRGGGAIVNTASGWGIAGGPRAVAYCASKGAVVQLTRALAIDHGADQVRVNCVCPGDTDTPMLRDEALQLGEPSARFLAEAARRPLGRVGSPEEIAAAIVYLAGDAAAFMTGAALVVDGGGLAGSV